MFAIVISIGLLELLQRVGDPIFQSWNISYQKCKTIGFSELQG